MRGADNVNTCPRLLSIAMNAGAMAATSLYTCPLAKALLFLALKCTAHRTGGYSAGG